MDTKNFYNKGSDTVGGSCRKDTIKMDTKKKRLLLVQIKSFLLLKFNNDIGIITVDEEFVFLDWRVQSIRVGESR